MPVHNIEKQHKEWLKQEKIAKERSRPWLPLLDFNAGAAFSRVLDSFSPAPAVPVNLFFSIQDTLACIISCEDRAEIFIHVLLNHRSTPHEVYRHIIVHELIHLAVPPVAVDGREVAHPEAFWEMEKQKSPERHRVWTWVYCNFCSCLKTEKKNERIAVLRHWKRAYGNPGLTWEQCGAFCSDPLY